MGTLRVVRRMNSFGCLAGIFSNVDVYVDQKKTGDVGMCSSFETLLTDGEHQVFVQMDNCKSREFWLGISDGQTIALEIGVPSFSGLSSVFRIFTHSNEFFTLTRISSAR
jgi:hypothetical protein